MKIKKELYLIIVFLFVTYENIFAQSAIKTLSILAIENNLDIQKAKAEYESAQIAERTLNGFYSPGVSINSSTIFCNENEVKTNLQDFSSNLIITQQFFGGSVLSINGTYGFSIWEDCGTKMKQKPGISCTLATSLYPYWMQGLICDPVIMTLKQQKEYCSNQLLSTKKEVLLSLVQNYAMAISYKKSIEIYENSIWLIQEQIDALKKLYMVGNTSQIKITELENSKWSYQQELISAMSNYEGYIQTLANLCGNNCIAQILDKERENTVEVAKLIGNHIDNVKDPYEKNLILQMDILETKRIQRKVNDAPNLSLTISPVLSLNETYESEWKKAWNQNNKITNWSVSLGIDFSKMIADFSSKSDKQAEIEYETAKRTYEVYLNQRSFFENQYESLLKSYYRQYEIVCDVLETGELELEELKEQLELGSVSSLDFYTKEINIKNMRLSKESVEIICWMYEILKELY